MAGKSLASDGGGTSIQATPLLEGGPGSTSGADDIDVSDARLIWFGTDCTIYEGTDSSNTLTVVAGQVFAVDSISSIHVDVATQYTLA